MKVVVWTIFSFVMCYVELFEGPDGNKLEEEVSMEPTYEAEHVEEDKKWSSHLMKLEGVRIVCPYPKLNLDTLWRQWELPIVKRQGQ